MLQAAATTPGLPEWRTYFIVDEAIEDLAVQALTATDNGFPLTSTINREEGRCRTIKCQIDEVVIGRVDEIGLNKFAQMAVNDDMPSYWLPELSNGVVRVTQRLKVDSAQGSVYRVQLHQTSPEVRELQKRIWKDDGTVDAIMKTTPIMGNNPDDVKEYIDSYLFDPDTIDTWLDDQVDFYDVNNPAYVDAIGCAVGDALVRMGASPFFCRLYGSLRSFLGRNYDLGDGTTARIEEPTQFLFMQPLDGTVKDLIDRGFYYTKDTPTSPRRPSARHIGSLYAQIIFGLYTAQKYFGLVHNDMHTENVMYEVVPYDTMLYYEYEGVMYAVPTFGKVYHLIDFGYASIPKLGVRSYILKDHYSDFNLDGQQNDLYRFTLAFLFETAAVLPENWHERFQLFKFMLACDDQGRSLLQQHDWSQLPPRRQVEEHRKVLIYYFGRENSTCTNSVPEKNIQWLSDYIVPFSTIPSSSLIYRL